MCSRITCVGTIAVCTGAAGLPGAAACWPSVSAALSCRFQRLNCTCLGDARASLPAPPDSACAAGLWLAGAVPAAGPPLFASAAALRDGSCGSTAAKGRA